MSGEKPCQSAVVLGGGVAGIAAAIRLAEAGVVVTLVETRKRLGGRATSHINNKTHEKIDNCQHVLLGCCTNLIDLYQRLGVSYEIKWHKQLHFMDKQGHLDKLRANGLPAPSHLSLSMLGFKTINFKDKLSIARAMMAMIRMGKTGREQLRDVTFGDWLKKHKPTDQAVERFWRGLVIGTCNLSMDQVSAYHAIQVFQEGMLAHRNAYLMGVAEVPLIDLYESVTHLIEQVGGKVKLGTSVEKLVFKDGQITGVALAGEEVIHADYYISCLPPDRLSKIVPSVLKPVDIRFGRLDQIKFSPIIGIHLWFEKSVIDQSHLFFVDSKLDWVFTKGTAHGSGDNSCHEQYLQCGISAADQWVDQSAEAIIQMAISELSDYLPDVKHVKLLRGRVIKERQATFAAAPGFDAKRPRATGQSNLLLAGNWCNTGWPATMEGAVRSGYMAAGKAVGGKFLVKDLPTSWLYRLLSSGQEDTRSDGYD